MSAPIVYTQIRRFLKQHIDEGVDESSLERLSLLVMGIIGAKSAAPARIAEALETLGLSGAKAESIERRIRRIENDPEISASLCFHPLARQRLLLGRPRELLLVLDPTTQEDHVVMVSAAVWYRGRALPLAWVIWPANTPLEGECFWARIAALLNMVAPLLPCGVSVTWLADRAFGTPAFTDLVTAHGWHYLVRVQGQTLCRDRLGREQQAQQLAPWPGQRAKRHGQVFKKRGWRPASLLVYWGQRYPERLCLVTDLRAGWYLIRVYRRRYSIEATFRDYKSAGWQWEQGQVIDLEHIQRLLVGMALATWVALMVGTQVATELLAKPPTGRRRTRPWEAKYSLFHLGLQRLHRAVHSDAPFICNWLLCDWDAPDWHIQICNHHAYAFIWAWDNGLCSS
jgi:hypothetical protein